MARYGCNIWLAALCSVILFFCQGKVIEAFLGGTSSKSTSGSTNLQDNLALAHGGSYTCQAGSEPAHSGDLTGVLLNFFHVDLQDNVWPPKYKKNMECTYTFNAPAGMHVYVDLVLCGLPDSQSSSCTGDRIELSRISHGVSGAVVSSHTYKSICYDPLMDNGGSFSHERSVEVKFISDGVDDPESAGCMGMMLAYNASYSGSLDGDHSTGLDPGNGLPTQPPIAPGLLDLLHQYSLLTTDQAQIDFVCDNYGQLSIFFPGVSCPTVAV